MSGFSNIRRVANFHAVGMWPICMEEVKSRAKWWNNEVVMPDLSTSLRMLSGPGALPRLTLFDMGGHDGPKMFLTTVSKRFGGGS